MTNTPRPANTKIHYCYRDGANYKQAHQVTLAGHISHDDLTPHLDDNLFFIPGQVGLEDLQVRFRVYGPCPNDDDHPWHELTRIEPTDDEPDQTITATDLVQAFQRVTWDEAHMYW